MAAVDLAITTSVLVHGQDLGGHKEMCEDAGSGRRVSASGGGWEVGLCRHFADAPARDHNSRLVPPQHLQQAASESGVLPLIIATFQFASGSFFITLSWLLNLHPKPRLSLQQCSKLLPLALIHVMGNAFTNMSLDRVFVSFTHTIKAM